MLLRLLIFIAAISIVRLYIRFPTWMEFESCFLDDFIIHISRNIPMVLRSHAFFILANLWRILGRLGEITVEPQRKTTILFVHFRFRCDSANWYTHSPRRFIKNFTQFKIRIECRSFVTKVVYSCKMKTQ